MIASVRISRRTSPAVTVVAWSRVVPRRDVPAGRPCPGRWGSDGSATWCLFSGRRRPRGATTASESAWRSLLRRCSRRPSWMFVITAVATDTRAVGELAAIAIRRPWRLGRCGRAHEVGAPSMNPARPSWPGARLGDRTPGVLAGSAGGGEHRSLRVRVAARDLRRRCSPRRRGPPRDAGVHRSCERKVGAVSDKSVPSYAPTPSAQPDGLWPVPIPGRRALRCPQRRHRGDRVPLAVRTAVRPRRHISIRARRSTGISGNLGLHGDGATRRRRAVLLLQQGQTTHRVPARPIEASRAWGEERLAVQARKDPLAPAGGSAEQRRPAPGCPGRGGIS